jgi:hypothetical protein
MRRTWVLLGLLAGCGGVERVSEPFDPGALLGDPREPDGTRYRGPGRWTANPEAQVPVEISLITSGLMVGDSTRANGRGDHVTFMLGGNVCEVEATTGNMDTDTPTEGESPGVEDGEPTGNALLVSSTGIYELVPALGGGPLTPGVVELVRKGSFSTARYVGSEVFAVTTGCELDLLDGSRVALSLEVCDEVAATDSALVFASDSGTLLADRDGSVVIDPLPSEHVTTVGASVFTLEDTRVRALSEGWQHELGADAVIIDLHSADDLGLVLVDLLVGERHEVQVLDAQTGEWLGTLELKQTDSVDVSPTGGLLLQLRGNDAVSWRIFR